MNPPPPRDAAGAGGGSGTATPAADNVHCRPLVALMLLGAAVLDLTRCGLVLATARHLAPAAWLIAAGLAAAAASVAAAHGCRGGRRWSALGALLIGAASAPQAAASGFHPPYAIPDTATAVLGILVTVAVLATAGRPGSLTATDEARDLHDDLAVGVREVPVGTAGDQCQAVDDEVAYLSPTRARRGCS
jgi:hypothetical protein